MFQYAAKINRVLDGDTFDATVDLGFGVFNKQRFRVNNFDAPETWRPRNHLEAEHGARATHRAKELLDGQTVIITSTHLGIYGRYGATVTLPDGRDFVEIMRSEGFEKLPEYILDEGTDD